jgi:hypothetical protein
VTINKGNSPGSPSGEPARPGGRAEFLQPRLIHNGDLVDLTTGFGGSLTPQERRDMGLDDNDDI